MTKADIVNEISKSTGVDKTAVLSIVEAFMETVKDSLAEDKKFHCKKKGRENRA